MNRRVVLVTLLLLAAACNPPDETACPDRTSPVTATVNTPVPLSPVTADLTVTGTLTKKPGVTVYDLLVADVAATSVGLDFAGFNATVPFARLQALAKGSTETPPIARVVVSARSNCHPTDAPAALTTFLVPVNLAPGIKVTWLAFDATLFPNGASYLPSDLSASALLQLRANPEAAGATVALTVSAGSLSGVATGNTVTLSGDGKGDAVAVFGLKTPTTAFVSASSTGAFASQQVAVAGPPVISPAGGTLTPGELMHVVVTIPGKLQGCQATPAQGISVVSGSSNLMAQPVGQGMSAGTLFIDVATPRALTDGGITTMSATTVSCTDIFGQLATATFSPQEP